MIGKKEKILELIKENDGLTYNKIIDKYNEKYNPDTVKRLSGYVYLRRLKKDGLIENDKGINVLYKPTSKALTDNPDDFEYLKELFERGAVKLYKSKLNQDDITRLETI
ncbi:MAG: winged helix-turn-helix domain-containing protein [Promethearchaeota archaeon]